MQAAANTTALEVLTFDNVCELAFEAEAIVIDGEIIDDIKPFYDWLGYNDKEAETTRIECSFVDQVLTLYRKIKAEGTIAERAVTWYSGYNNSVLSNALQADSLGAYQSNQESSPFSPMIVTFPDQSTLSVVGWDDKDEIPTLTAGQCSAEDLVIAFPAPKLNTVTDQCTETATENITVAQYPQDNRFLIRPVQTLNYNDGTYKGRILWEMAGTAFVVLEYNCETLVENPQHTIEETLVAAGRKHVYDQTADVLILNRAADK